MRLINSKRGQIWVETVLYTLIGLAIIGILLAIAKPKIDSMKDGFFIDNSIRSLGKIDAKIFDVRVAPTNIRNLPVEVSKGKLIIDAKNDVINWTIDSKKEYSEPGVSISLGRIRVLTTESNPWTVDLSMNYTVNITYEGKDIVKVLEVSSTPYRLRILNNGSTGDLLQIDLIAI